LIQKLLRKKKDRFEALAWLKGSHAQSQRNLSEWTNAQSVEMVQQLYGCGAAEVLAVRFDRNPPYESINTLIVALPADSVKRFAVFEWANEQIEKQGFDPEEDYGQPYLYIWFD